MSVLYLVKGLLDRKHFFGHTSYHVYLCSSKEKDCVSVSSFLTCSFNNLTSDVSDFIAASREDVAPIFHIIPQARANMTTTRREYILPVNPAVSSVVACEE